MISMKITVDTRKLTAALDDLARRQIPFATATALNATAKLAATQANTAMANTFTRANAFTRNAVTAPRELAATKTTLSATVALRPIQAKYLGLEIEGGTRTPASNTRSSSQALVLPGRGPAPLQAGAVKRIAAQAAADRARRAAVQAGTRKARKGAADTGVFMMSGHGPSDGVGGFFRRLPGHHLVRLVAFEATAQYRPKFDFKAQILSTVAGNFERLIEQQLARAIATAKPR